jgi:hypothetical protein
MKRLLVFALIAFAAWYGWKHYADLRSLPVSEVVIQNESGKGLDRVRMTVEGKTEVREHMDAGANVTVPFNVRSGGPLQLKWQFERTEVDKNWNGGMVTPGPIPMRHHLQVLPDGVVWSEEKIEKPAGK